MVGRIRINYPMGWLAAASAAIQRVRRFVADALSLNCFAHPLHLVSRLPSLPGSAEPSGGWFHLLTVEGRLSASVTLVGRALRQAQGERVKQAIGPPS